MYSRTVAIIGGFLVLASGAGELYRRKPRSRSLQSTGQVFLGIYLICVVCWGSRLETLYGSDVSLSLAESWPLSRARPCD